MTSVRHARTGPAACRVIGLLLLLLLPRLTAGTPPLSAQALPAGFDAGLFDLRLPALAPRTVPALVNAAGEVLLPVLPVAAATGIPATLSADGSLLSLPRLHGGEARLWPDAGLLVVGPDSVRLSAAELQRYDGDVYLRSDRLARLLDARADVDFSSLSVVLSRDPPFPSEQRREAEARREWLRRGARADSTPRELAFVPRTGVGTLAWSYSSADLAQPELSRLRLLGGGSVLGGALAAGFTVARDPLGGAGVTQPVVSYTRVFPNGALLRQLRLGDVTAGPLQQRAFRGVLLSNAEYRPPLHFGSVLLDPDLPPGWSYEVYDGERLVGFSDAGDPGPVQVPVDYGSTQMKIRMYGPAGQSVVSDFRYVVPHSQLPGGRWEYSLAGGACVTAECDSYGFLNARYGLSRWLTLGAGASRLAASAGSEVQPQLEASLALPGGVSGVLNHAAGLTQGSVSYLGSGPLWWEAQGFRSRPGSGRLSFLTSGSSRWGTSFSTGVRSTRYSPLVRSLRFGAGVEGAAGEGVDRVHASTGWSARRTLLGLGYEWNRLQAQGLFTTDATSIVPSSGSWPVFLRGRPVTSRLTWSAAGLQQAELSTGVRLGVGELRLAGGWERSTGEPSFSVSYGAELGGSRVQLRAARLPVVGVVTSAYAEGLVAFSGPGGLLATSRSAGSVGGVTGTVFEDRNGNGTRDPEEPGVAEARVVVGALQAVTDSVGRYRIWGIPAYDATLLRVDTLSLRDPRLVPARRQLWMRANPYVFTGVDFPLATTRELTGEVVADRPVVTAGGVTVVIRSLATGDSLHTVTFDDGEYYLSRIAPGDYVLHVSPASLDALRARAVPDSLRFTVPGGQHRILRRSAAGAPEARRRGGVRRRLGSAELPAGAVRQRADTPHPAVGRGPGRPARHRRVGHAGAARVPGVRLRPGEPPPRRPAAPGLAGGAHARGAAAPRGGPRLHRFERPGRVQPAALAHAGGGGGALPHRARRARAARRLGRLRREEPRRAQHHPRGTRAEPARRTVPDVDRRRHGRLAPLLGPGLPNTARPRWTRSTGAVPRRGAPPQPMVRRSRSSSSPTTPSPTPPPPRSASWTARAAAESSSKP